MPNPDPVPVPKANPRPPERRKIPRESSPTSTPPHTAEKPGSPASLAIAPHMAESEPVTEAEVVTIKSPQGESTSIVERAPGQATHITVVDEKSAPQTREKKARPVPRRRRPARRRR